MFLKKLFHLMPQDPLTEGLDLFNDGRFDEALARFESLVNAEDEGIKSKARLYACESHLLLGEQRRVSDVPAALDHYLKASDYQPHFADLHNKAGEMCRRLGRTEHAVEAFRKALRINEHYFIARLNLAETLGEAGDLRGCVPEIRQLVESCPQPFRGHCEDLMTAATAGDNDRLSAVFREIRELDPDRVSLVRERALGFLRKGDPNSAARLLEKLVAEYPRFPDLHHVLGLAYGDMGRSAEAMEEFREALRIQPKYLKARINLGILLMEEDRLVEAREELAAVLEVDPSNPLAAHALREIETLSSSV